MLLYLPHLRTSEFPGSVATYSSIVLFVLTASINIVNEWMGWNGEHEYGTSTRQSLGGVFVVDGRNGRGGGSEVFIGERSGTSVPVVTWWVVQLK